MRDKSDVISKSSGTNTLGKQNECLHSSLKNNNGPNPPENEQTSTVSFSDATACLFQGMFSKNSQAPKNNEIDVLIRKYKLKDDSKVELEKGLRNAATNGDLKNIKLILTKELDINAQDANQKSRKTALHWAVIKKHGSVIEYLLEKGAQFNIPDADGSTALDYADEGMKNFFKGKIEFKK